MNDTNEPRLVKALYNYKGANNDEVSNVSPLQDRVTKKR